MTEEQYLKTRVEDQIKWYDKKSVSNKQGYFILKVLEIIFASAIPIISLFNNEWARIVIAILGALISVIASVLALYKPNDKWKQYRNTAEALKNEKYIYLAKTGYYLTDEPFKVLVEKIEFIVSKENSNWTQIIGITDNQKDK
jgi:Protein of unknown function (DUF4231)